MSWLNCIHSNTSAVTQSVLCWPHTRRYWADSELQFPTAMIGEARPNLQLGRKRPFVQTFLECLMSIRLLHCTWSSWSWSGNCKFQTCLIYMIQCWAATDGSSAISGEKEQTGKHHFYSMSLSPILFIPLFSQQGHPTDSTYCPPLFVFLLKSQKFVHTSICICGTASVWSGVLEASTSVCVWRIILLNRLKASLCLCSSTPLKLAKEW